MKKTARLLSVVLVLMLVISFIPGTALVARASGDISGTPEAAWTITLSPESLEFTNDSYKAITPTVLKDGSAPAADDEYSVVWSVKDNIDYYAEIPAAADKTGCTVYPKNNGQTKVIAQLKVGDEVKATAEADVTISGINPDWSLSTTVTKSMDMSRTDTATAKAANNGKTAPASEYSVKWRSSNPSVLAINETSGAMTPKSVGSAVVTADLYVGGATTPETSVQKTVTVTDASAPTVEYKGSDLWVGDEVKLDNMFTVNNASVGDLTWTTSNDKVAAIKDGKIKAVGRGSVTVEAKDKNGKSLGKFEDIHVDQYYCKSPAKLPAKWKKGSKDSLDFEIACQYHESDTFKNFKCAKVDGTEITLDKDYTKSSGSVWIKLQPSYLESLKVGKEYTLAVVFDDGNGDGGELGTEVKFKIVDSSSGADTKDMTLIGLGVFLFLLSLTYVALFTYDKKTRRFKRRAYAFSHGNSGRSRGYSRPRSNSSRSRRRYY